MSIADTRYYLYGICPVLANAQETHGLPFVVYGVCNHQPSRIFSRQGFLALGVF